MKNEHGVDIELIVFISCAASVVLAGAVVGALTCAGILAVCGFDRCTPKSPLQDLEAAAKAARRISRSHTFSFRPSERRSSRRSSSHSTRHSRTSSRSPQPAPEVWPTRAADTGSSAAVGGADGRDADANRSSSSSSSAGHAGSNGAGTAFSAQPPPRLPMTATFGPGSFGLGFGVTRDGTTVVTSVDGPAAAQGVPKYTIVASVNGASVAGLQKAELIQTILEQPRPITLVFDRRPSTASPPASPPAGGVAAEAEEEAEEDGGSSWFAGLWPAAQQPQQRRQQQQQQIAEERQPPSPPPQQQQQQRAPPTAAAAAAARRSASLAAHSASYADHTPTIAAHGPPTMSAEQSPRRFSSSHGGCMQSTWWTRGIVVLSQLPMCTLLLCVFLLVGTPIFYIQFFTPCSNNHAEAQTPGLSYLPSALRTDCSDAFELPRGK